MKRNPVLDGIRCYACLAIIIFHALLFLKPGTIPPYLIPFQFVANNDELLSKISIIFFNGPLALTFFFMLSGIVLFQSLCMKQYNDIFTTSVDFVFKRIARLYPALIVFLLIFFIINQILHLAYPVFFPAFSYKNLINNILLYNTNISMITWTLKVEVLIVPFILMVFYFFKTFGPSALFAVLGFSILAYEHSWLIFNIYAPLFNTTLIYFAFGFIIPTQIGKQIFSFFKPKHTILLLLLAFLVVQFVLNSITSVLAQTILVFCVVGILYHQQSGTLYRILTTKFATYFGKISYSLYLYNMIFLTIIDQFMRPYLLPFQHFVLFGILSGLLVILIATPFAHFSQKYIERTFIKLNNNFLKNLFSNRKPISIMEPP